MGLLRFLLFFFFFFFPLGLWSSTSVLGRLVVVQGDGEEDAGVEVSLLSCDRTPVAEIFPNDGDRDVVVFRIKHATKNPLVKSSEGKVRTTESERSKREGLDKQHGVDS